MKTHTKKWLTALLTAFLMINLGLTVSAFLSTKSANADDPTTTSTVAPAASPLSQLLQVGNGTKLPDFYFGGGQHPEAAVDYEYKGVGTLTSAVLFLIDLFKYLVSGLAVVMIIVYSIRYVVAGSDEDNVKKSTKGLGMSIAGLIIIQLADVLVRNVFFGEYGEVLEDATSAEQFAQAGTEQLRGIIGFVQVALGGIAVLVIIINGLKIMITGVEEEKRKKSLANIGYAAGGLIIVAISEIVVKGFIFRDQGESIPNVTAGRSLIIMITNFISGFIAVIAFVMLIYAGYTYVVAGTDETARGKVKKLILAAVIGIILALGAYAITNTVLTFQETNEYIPVDETIK